MDFPVPHLFDLPGCSITGHSKDTSIWDLIDSCGSSLGTAAVWPAANRAIFLPVYLAVPFMARKVAWFNGGTAANNVDVGIYTRYGAKIVSSGSVAAVGTNTIQVADITDTEILPGIYFMAMSVNGTTGVFFRSNGVSTAIMRVSGISEMDTAFALPATATFAVPTAAYIPRFGLLGNAAA